MTPHLPTTPSKPLKTHYQSHSRQVSSEAGTEFGTPESTFPTDSPTIAESTRPTMVGLGLSTPISTSNGSRSPAQLGHGGDVFGSGQRLDLNDGQGRDAAMDEVDQFLNEAARDSEDPGTRGSSLDYNKTRLELNMPSQRRNDSSTSSFAQSPGSHTSDPLLEVLDDDEDEEDEEEMELFEDGDGDGDEGDFDSQEPLVGRRGRKRRRWAEGGERRKDASLLELIPPLVLAHPLALFPLLAILPYSFLPAGVVFFIPVLSVLAILSACAQIVIVYLSWYLKVSSFEEIFATVAGRFGRYGLWAGRAAVISATIGMLISWLGALHHILGPVQEHFLGHWSARASRLSVTIVSSLTLLPSLLPSRMTRSLKRAPVVLVLLLPIVTFIIIGRTVEIARDRITYPEVTEVEKRALTDVVASTLGLGGTSSAGAGITKLTLFLSPHVCTLSTHSQLARSKRTSFPLPAIASSLVVLVLSLPGALVPYYLFPPPTEVSGDMPTVSHASGILSRFPDADLSINVARVFMAAMVLGTCNMWILRGRDTVLRSMGVDRGERIRAGKWVGLGLWAFVVAVACLGGWVADKLEIMGVIATIAVSWLLPSIFFIITFHVRSPLSIVFPSKNPPPEEGDTTPRSSPSRSGSGAGVGTNGHARTDSMTDPTQDVLLARKERQLQKRRLGRRLWQDLIVYIGILPVGCITIAWSLGRLLGIW